jgi:alpha-galactosidase/6-phospho-beta-glucosidase family protein
MSTLEALSIDPTVPDPAAAEKILDEMLMAQAELLSQFNWKKHITGDVNLK